MLQGKRSRPTFTITTVNLLMWPFHTRKIQAGIKQPGMLKYYFWFSKRPYRLMVRTALFQGANQGSIPCRVTNNLA